MWRKRLYVHPSFTVACCNPLLFLSLVHVVTLFSILSLLHVVVTLVLIDF